MGGVFDSYGDDFLDRFNASINGPGATESFEIKAGPPKINDLLQVALYRDAYLDLFYNLENEWMFVLVVLAFGAVTVLISLWDRLSTTGLRDNHPDENAGQRQES